MADPDKTVFLSYRRDVSWAMAHLVRNDLVAHDFDVFMDVHGIDSGEFERVILREIEERTHFLVLLEPRSLDRISEPGDWLRREIAHALAHRRNVVPVLANGARMPRATDLLTDLGRLPSFNAVSVPHDYFAEAMQKLRERFLRPPAPTPRPPHEAAREVSIQSLLPLVPGTLLGPRLVAPELTARRTGFTATLSWTEFDGATGYELQQSDASDFAQPTARLGPTAHMPIRFCDHGAATGGSVCARSGAARRSAPRGAMRSPWPALVPACPGRSSDPTSARSDPARPARVARVVGASGYCRAVPDLHRATLANGLRVLLAPDPNTPVVGVAVHVDVGFRSEPEGRTGFAHLFEHLMFQGSESLEKLAHFRHVQGSGGVFNGSTHQDYTDYFEVLPAAALERALFLEADRLRAPKLTAENLRNQVDVVKEEIRLNVLNRPYGGFPWILLPPVLYDTFPNAHNGYGDFTELEQASLDDAAAFFDTYYAPGNAQVTVAGYLGDDVDRVLALVEEHFGDIPARPTPSRPSFAEPPPGAERRAVSPDAHAPLPALAVGYRLPDPGADLDAYLGHALLGSILGDGEAARLQRRLVHVDGLVTDVSASAGLMGPLDARDPDTFTITAVHPPSVDPDRVLAAVDEELDKLAAAGPGADELARQVARWSAALYHEDDRVMYRMLGLGARELLYGRAELALELPDRLAAVTPEQVREAAAALRGQGRAVLIVEPATQPTEEQA